MESDILKGSLYNEVIVEEIIRDVIQLFLIPKFMSLGMDATGEWRESLEAKGNMLRGRSYTEQLEYGRRPGKFAPIAPLIKWVEAKFGLSGAEAVSVAWAVNQKIKAEGTSHYKTGGTDLMEILQSKEVIDFINERISIFMKGRVKTYFSQVLLKELKKK